jgi:RNA 2',3'-cyclic 3'-phosphodiesterase
MRLFIATPLSKETEEYLAKVIFELKQVRSKVKWVAAKNIHLTLKFLGDTEESKVEPIKAAIQKVADNSHSAKCTIDKLGGFPNLKRPRVIWAGISGEIDKIKSIASEIDNEMNRLGFEKEDRPFKSHLTLGRVKESSGLKDLTEAVTNYKLNPQNITFDKIILFKSTLTAGGPIYESLFEAEIK